MGRLIILPLRVSVEIPDLEGEPITLPTISVPGAPTPPVAGTPPVTAIPPIGDSVYIEDLSGLLPREEANTPTPARAYKTSLTVHWLGDAGPSATDDGGIRAELDRIAREHIAKDWGGGSRGSGVMYHEAIAPSGTVFVLRDYTEIPWHAGNYEANLHSRAILVMCSVAVPPTAAQIRVLKQRYFDFQVPWYGHREWSATQCPGQQLMEVVESVR